VYNRDLILVIQCCIETYTYRAISSRMSENREGRLLICTSIKNTFLLLFTLTPMSTENIAEFWKCIGGFGVDPDFEAVLHHSADVVDGATFEKN
jgi:hypothetical protein